MRSRRYSEIAAFQRSAMNTYVAARQTCTAQAQLGTTGHKPRINMNSVVQHQTCGDGVFLAGTGGRSSSSSLSVSVCSITRPARPATATAGAGAAAWAAAAAASCCCICLSHAASSSSSSSSAALRGAADASPCKCSWPGSPCICAYFAANSSIVPSPSFAPPSSSPSTSSTIYASSKCKGE